MGDCVGHRIDVTFPMLIPTISFLNADLVLGQFGPTGIDT